MELETGRLAALALLVALSTAGFAQQFQPNQPTSSVKESPAVAWSEMQTPQPVPSEEAVPRPGKQQEQQLPDNPTATPPQASGMPAHSESVTQTFTGTVVRIGDKYVLRTTDNTTYQLDDPDKAKEYEGKQVKVTGSLDPKGKLIHIQNVEVS